MEKIKIFLLLIICTCIVGCGSSGGVSQEEYDSVVAERDALLEKVATLDSELSDSTDTETLQIESTVNENDESDDSSKNYEEDGDEVQIVTEYTLAGGRNYTYHFMIITNNSDKTLEISSASLAYSKDGEIIGAADSSFDALGSGCTSVMYELFETTDTIDHYETELTTSSSGYYESVIQDMTYTQNDIKKGAVYQVTNNGDSAAKFVEGYALFFSGKELVAYDRIYFTDDDNEIKSGKTISKQLTTSKEYDNIEFYLSGRR
jgi:hypothetical protein